MVNTPNMNLSQPTINVDSGLVWEQSSNNNSDIIDQHNHAPGSGVQIGASGINLSDDLSFNNNQAINLMASIYTSQTSLATVNAVYVKLDGNLYFNDGASNVVQLTTGGAVNATSSGISSGTATASFVSSVLVVNSAANTPANIQGGSILIGNNLSGSKFLTLAPPTAMAANYSITLPALPVGTSIMQLDTSGNMSAVLTIDTSTMQISSNLIGVKPLGIDTAQLKDASVTPAKKAALGQQLSSSTGNFSSSSTSYVDITNATVTITTTGRPVFVGLIPDGSASLSFIDATGSGGFGANFKIFRGATAIAIMNFGGQGGSSGNAPCTAIQTIDIVAAGTYTYKIQGELNASAPTIFGVKFTKLIAFEL